MDTDAALEVAEALTNKDKLREIDLNGTLVHVFVDNGG